MSNKKKMKKLIYFTLEFVSIGIDMVHPLNYAFWAAVTIIGYDLLYQDKKWREIPKLQYLLGLIIIPVFVGWMLKNTK